jgi:hypothetical protein
MSSFLGLLASVFHQQGHWIQLDPQLSSSQAISLLQKMPLLLVSHFFFLMDRLFLTESLWLIPAGTKAHQLNALVPDWIADGRTSTVIHSHSLTGTTDTPHLLASAGLLTKLQPRLQFLVAHFVTVLSNSL